MDEKLDKIVEIVSKQLEFKNAFTAKFLKEAIQAIQRFDAKHSEKGFGEYADYGPIGVMVKMSEPYNNLKCFYTSHDNRDEDKAVLDKHWTDVAVYALIGKLVADGNWKE